MYRLHVSFQLVAVFVTKMAVVRLLPSVNSPLHDKVGRVRENLETLDTGIWLVFQMMILMDSQWVSVCKTFVTIHALMYVVAYGDVRMLPKQLVVVEVLSTSFVPVLVVEIEFYSVCVARISLIRPALSCTGKFTLGRSHTTEVCVTKT